MGLDMYFKDAESGDELFYFRKHSDLHGWLTRQWRDIECKPDSADLNCERFEITPELVDKLEAYIAKGKIVHFEGFFWGKSLQEDWDDTKLKLIPLLRKKFDEGCKVVYWASF